MSTVPIGSMWTSGFRLTRPASRAVWSPMREAVHAWAASWKLRLKSSTT